VRGRRCWGAGPCRRAFLLFRQEYRRLRRWGAVTTDDAALAEAPARAAQLRQPREIRNLERGYNSRLDEAASAFLRASSAISMPGTSARRRIARATTTSSGIPGLGLARPAMGRAGMASLWSCAPRAAPTRERPGAVDRCVDHYPIRAPAGRLCDLALPRDHCRWLKVAATVLSPADGPACEPSRSTKCGRLCGECCSAPLVAWPDG